MFVNNTNSLTQSVFEIVNNLLKKDDFKSNSNENLLKVYDNLFDILRLKLQSSTLSNDPTFDFDQQ